jgi:hypothetical protein
VLLALPALRVLLERLGRLVQPEKRFFRVLAFLAAGQG